MGVDAGYFFDSYALIEIIKSNPSYAPYIESDVAMTILNLVEITNAVFLDLGEKKAKETYEKFSECVQEITWEITLEAIRIKSKHKKRHLSYADCIGYAFARKNNLLFLTGDKEFKDLPGVEFVK